MINKGLTAEQRTHGNEAVDLLGDSEGVSRIFPAFWPARVLFLRVSGPKQI